MRILINGKLNLSQQCAVAAERTNSILGYIKCSIASCSKKVIDLLYYALVLPHLEYCVHFWVPQYEKAAAECPEEGYEVGEGFGGETAKVAWFVQPRGD